MDPKSITLFVYDSKDNFDKSKEFFGGFKEIVCIESIDDLNKYFETSLLSDDEYVYMAVHVFAFDEIKGIRKFLTSGIREKYSHLDFMYISEGDERDIKYEMVEKRIATSDIHAYHEVFSRLRDGNVKARTKREILNHSNGASKIVISQENASEIIGKYPQCDYAIITALEEDEMEKVLSMITTVGRIPNEKHLIEHGHLTTNPEKKIVYASQQATGMIDAAILSTELILRFQPRFLIMAGVLGGNPDDVKIGDVIIATRAYTIDKGKFAEYGFKKEIETSSNEHASITKLIRNKKQIVQYLRDEDKTRTSEINIHFGSIACVRQVISLEGYFIENITPVDRKTLALEMESYAVSRACELVNDGKTKALIIKSVMDLTQGKGDKEKPYAAWSSAECIKYILENDLI